MNALSTRVASRALAAAILFGAAAAAMVTGTAPAAWAGTPATTADDICASNANPCNVTKVYDITAGAVLDFGVRTVAVSGAGELNFSNGSGKIQCGTFSASTTGTFLNASGPSPNGGTSSGSVLLLARRRCSIANPLVPCLDNGECELGPCGVRRCSLKTTRACTADTDCQLGTCNALHRCANNTSVRCLSDTDCNFGTCPAQLTCTGRGDSPVNCLSNTDCSFGTCSVGTGSATLDGVVAGSSDRPATLVVRAADSVSISKAVNLNSSAIDSDGGSLSVDARGGSITITNKINATGGGQSTGGSVELAAGTDITVSDDINVVGGDFDGGSIDFTAGRDITLGRSILANSGSGAGFGGDITIDAGRDFFFTGISAANKSTIEMSGHTDIENSSGDGGSFDLMTGRNLSLGLNTRIIGNGSFPDGTAAEFSMDAGASATLSGDVVAKATGVDGSGGFVQVIAELGTATVNPTATFDVTGGSGGGGYLEIESSGGDLDFDGDSDVSASAGGSGGTTSLNARQAAHVSGTLLTSGINGGYLSVDACRVTLESGGTLDNNADGINTLIAHDDMHLNAGSFMTTDAGGTNTLRFRDSTKTPVVQGTVTPAPRFVFDPSLTDCPLCGNGTVDPGESCDDANVANGDGCNEDCQNEKCVTQTISPGYPAVALCEDGNLCTADVCNTSLNGGTCQHPPKTCSDGISCTADTCDPADGSCGHAPSDALCNDNNTCTDDFCSLSMGCSNTANSSTCDDKNRCTNNDVCANKVCKGTRINGCLFCGDDYLNPLGGEECDDGNQADGDCCSANCLYEASNSVCEDGLFCTVNDRCDAAAHCVSGPPNTCADTNGCTVDSCDEETISCVHAETPRDPSSCFNAPGAKLQIKNSTTAKRDKLSWQWNNGNAFGTADLGTPTADTDYTLCVYDQSATGPSLAAAIDIAPSADFWSAKAPMIQYKDKGGMSEGVLKAQLRAGEDGNTRVRVGAGGSNLALPAPAGTTYFHQSPSVVVQLINDMGKCWTSQFTAENTKTNDAGAFKAATK